MNMIIDLQTEHNRAAKFCQDNGYHNGTAIGQVVRNYVEELDKLTILFKNDFEKDEIEIYTEIIE